MCMSIRLSVVGSAYYNLYIRQKHCVHLDDDDDEHCCKVASLYNVKNEINRNVNDEINLQSFQQISSFMFCGG